jgi:alpha-L-fucosidase
MVRAIKGAFILLMLLMVSGLYAKERMEDGWITSIRNAPEMKDAIEKWEDIGFEIFVHWSAGVAYQGRYHGKELTRDLWGEWMMVRAGIPVSDYEATLKSWNPKDFSAAEWADVFEESGAKMVVYIAKHHDGFAQFKSKANDYNTYDWGAFHKDVFGELCSELHKRGIKTGFYYSHGKDWRNNSRTRNADKDAQEKYFEDVVFVHLKELNENYGHQEVCWFDLGAPTKELAIKCLKVLRKTNPYILSSSRVGFHLGDFSTGGDGFIPPVPKDGPWETCMTFTYHWAWYPEDRAAKRPEEVIQMLARIRSRGGNLLLNIGPDVRGKIPFQEKNCLEKVGKWLKVNGDSIYGVRASGFADLPWGVCTKKPGKLFLHILQLPYLDYIYLPGVESEVTGAYLLADKNKTPLKIERDAFGGRKIYLYDADSDCIDYTDTVVVLTYKGELKIDTTQVLDNDLSTKFVPQIAKRHNVNCSSTRLTPKTNHGGVEAPLYCNYAHGFGTADAKVDWDFSAVETNAFYINVNYANCTDKTLKAIVTVGEHKYSVDLPPTVSDKTFDWDSFRLTFRQAPILIKPGRNQHISFELDPASVTDDLNQNQKHRFRGRFLLESLVLRPAYPPVYRGYGGSPDTTPMTEEIE